MKDKTFRKDFSENLSFIQDQFIEKLSVIRQGFILATDLSIDNEFNFKSLEHEISQYEEETGAKIFKIIALQSPKLSDLRLLLGILQSLNDIYRITKTIIRISKVFRRYNSHPGYIDISLLQNFEEMSQKLVIMMDQIIKFNFADDLSNETASSFQQQLTIDDDYIDSLFKDIYKILIEKITDEIDSKKQAKSLVELIIVVRHMERMGDHLCNIAEKFLFIKTGNHYVID